MKRILIIDDNDEFREMLHLKLEREGFEVSEASDGEIGLNMLEKQQVDLVITDIIMPNKEGIGTIIDLRAKYKELRIEMKMTPPC